MNERIYLKRKVTGNSQNCIKLTGHAMDLLAEVVSETNMSIRQVASEIITQAIEKDLIRFE